LCVFAAILYAVWYYVYPRLFGEVVAATADVQFYEIVEEASEASTKWQSPDGATYLLGQTPVLVATDLATFQPQMVSANSDQAQVRLTIVLSSAGKVKLDQFMAGRTGTESLSERSTEGSSPDTASSEADGTSKTMLGMVIRKHFVGMTSAANAQSGKLVVSLTGLSRDEVEEIFARLTE
ncbi:MAG: hypothetical protein ACK526_07860, partial [Planctomyces sp.]